MKISWFVRFPAASKKQILWLIEDMPSQTKQYGTYGLCTSINVRLWETNVPGQLYTEEFCDTGKMCFASLSFWPFPVVGLARTRCTFDGIAACICISTSFAPDSYDTLDLCDCMHAASSKRHDGKGSGLFLLCSALYINPRCPQIPNHRRNSIQDLLLPFFEWTRRDVWLRQVSVFWPYRHKA